MTYRAAPWRWLSSAGTYGVAATLYGALFSVRARRNFETHVCIIAMVVQ
jgi:hypothetical protein